MSSALTLPAEAGHACPGCGWLEPLGTAECRSCGDSIPTTLTSNAPVPALQALLQIAPSPCATLRPTGPQRPVFLSDPRQWEGWPRRFTGLLVRPGALLLLALLAFSWHFGSGRPLIHPPGILIRDEPLQGPVPTGQGFWQSGDTNIRALASYNIKARLLHAERYRWDAMADLAPIDLGVGWGVMSDEAHAARCEFSNSGRFLNWWWSAGDSPGDEAARSMTNMHMLPANDRVRDRLLSLRPGQLFQAGGYLVEVMRPGMGPWTSSLSRLDTGAGACEIMWVQTLLLLP